AVLYSSIVMVSMGAHRRLLAGGLADTEATPAETIQREVWSHLCSKFILSSFFLVSALTAARGGQTLSSSHIYATLAVALPLIALLAAVGLLSSRSQLVKLVLRTSGFAAVLGTSLFALLAAQLLVTKVPEVFGEFGKWLVYLSIATLWVYTLFRNGPNTF